MTNELDASVTTADAAVATLCAYDPTDSADDAEKPSVHTPAMADDENVSGMYAYVKPEPEPQYAAVVVGNVTYADSSVAPCRNWNAAIPGCAVSFPCRARW